MRVPRVVNLAFTDNFALRALVVVVLAIVWPAGSHALRPVVRLMTPMVIIHSVRHSTHTGETTALSPRGLASLQDFQIQWTALYH